MYPIVHDPRAVGLVQRRDEPEVARRREEEAGGVVRAAPERDQAGEDEREACRHGEPGDEPGSIVVVAREDECDRDGCLEEGSDARDPESQGPHGRSDRIASPESSPFGTNPIALLDSTCVP